MVVEVGANRQGRDQLGWGHGQDLSCRPGVGQED